MKENTRGIRVCTHARARAYTFAYEPFHAFPRHARKFTPPKPEGREERKTESPITFSISGRTELSSGSRRALRPALALIINAHGVRVRLPFFFSLFPYLQHASFAILLRDKPRIRLYAPSLYAGSALRVAARRAIHGPAHLSIESKKVPGHSRTRYSSNKRNIRTDVVTYSS